MSAAKAAQLNNTNTPVKVYLMRTSSRLVQEQGGRPDWYELMHGRAVFPPERRGGDLGAQDDGAGEAELEYVVHVPHKVILHRLGRAVSGAHGNADIAFREAAAHHQR